MQTKSTQGLSGAGRKQGQKFNQQDRLFSYSSASAITEEDFKAGSGGSVLGFGHGYQHSNSMMSKFLFNNRIQATTGPGMGALWLPLARAACLTAVALSSAREVNTSLANTWTIRLGKDGYFNIYCR